MLTLPHTKVLFSRRGNRRSNSGSAIFAGLFGVLVCLGLMPDLVADDELDNEIRIGYFIDPIDKVDRSDLKYTLDAWADNFGSDRYPLIKVTTFENEARFKQSLSAGTLDLGVIYSYQYETVSELKASPQYLVGRDVEPLVEFILLVRGDAGIDSAHDLKGKKIIVNTGRRGKLPLMWLRRFMLSEGVNEDTEIFGDVEYAADSFNSIAPVFFKNADACVITRREFQENAMLNAELVQKLHDVASSLNMPTRVLLFSPVIDQSKRDLIELRAEEIEPAIYPQTFLDEVKETIIDFQKGDLAEVVKLALPYGLNAEGKPILTRTEGTPIRDEGEETE